jgi:hypothetical protein
MSSTCWCVRETVSVCSTLQSKTSLLPWLVHLDVQPDAAAGSTLGCGAFCGWAAEACARSNDRTARRIIHAL